MQRALYEKLGAQQLRTLLESRPRGSVDVVAAEVSFSFGLGAQKIVGRIDRLDRVEGNTVRVIDYKSGAAKTPRYAEDSLPFSIYAREARDLGVGPRAVAFLNLYGNEGVTTSRFA